MDRDLLRKLIIDEHANIRDAFLSFEKHGMGVVLVCDAQRKLLGLATEGDVRRALLAGHGLLTRVLSLANRSPVVGTTKMSRTEMTACLSERIHHLPILGPDGRLEDILFADRRTVIPVTTPIIGERELRYVTEAVLSGWVSSQGKYIELFEKKFAEFCGTKHAVVVSNGTVALHLALIASGVGAGDEVIVPALTFAATANAVLYCHAKPVFVDIDAATWNIDCAKIEAAITPRTKAIIPVHLYGNPCDMESLLPIARKHKLAVIEDAAEAHGAEYGNRRVGGLGDLGAFSFFGNKLITTGEGGALVCNDSSVRDRLRVLRDHGMSKQKRYWHEVVGYNYRMTNLQAALGVAQLERWDQIIAAKTRISQCYDDRIALPGLTRIQPTPNAKAVCWIYTVLLQPSVAQLGRDEVLERLIARGVDCRPAFYPLPFMPPYYEDAWETDYPNANLIGLNSISLPSSVELVDADLDRIVEAVNSVYSRPKHVAAKENAH